MVGVVGCSGGADDVKQPTDTTTSPTFALAVLHGQVDVLGDAGDGLHGPTDLAFDPDDPGTLWVVSRDDDSVTRYAQAGEPDQQAEHIVDPYALHFMEQVSSIAFGAPGRFATCQDSRNTYDGSRSPNDFMGPTLWSSDPAVFGVSNPDAVAFLSAQYGFHVDLGSHLDMLHETPLCRGIAWEADNVYWVFDGADDALARVDFRQDHGPGYDDHSDGVVERWVEGEVARQGSLASHLEYDPQTAELFVADTGNGRIAVLDTTTGARGADLPTKEPGTEHYQWEGAVLTTLVDTAAIGLEAPVGLALIDDLVFVTDAGGTVAAFDRTGAEVDRVDLGRPGLSGIVARSAGELWLVDREAGELLRLTK
ncbi:MAG: hypothetical protein R3F59_12045 [Myxococcota bacterium]